MYAYLFYLTLCKIFHCKLLQGTAIIMLLWCRALACIQSAQLWLIYVCSVQYYAVASLLRTLNLFVMYTPPVYITVRTVQAG